MMFAFLAFARAFRHLCKLKVKVVDDLGFARILAPLIGSLPTSPDAGSQPRFSAQPKETK